MRWHLKLPEVTLGVIWIHPAMEMNLKQTEKVSLHVRERFQIMYQHLRIQHIVHYYINIMLLSFVTTCAHIFRKEIRLWKSVYFQYVI